MTTYQIIRKFANGDSKTITTGLTLEEAQEHCSDPETSSRTCTSAEGRELTSVAGAWMDCYYEE